MHMAPLLDDRKRIPYNQTRGTIYCIKKKSKGHYEVMIMSSQAGDEWLSLREAANLLGMHPATIRLWADRNEIPSRRTSGGHRRFRRADIEARLRQEVERRPQPAAQLLVQSVLGRV